MKNYRFLSSLALTGMLATSIMGTTVNAATPTVETVGVSTISGVKYVPVVVKDGAVKATVADVTKKVEVVSVNGATANSTTLVKTGDKLKIKGSSVDHVAIVYGDVNQDGEVDIFDATYLQENLFETLSEAQQLAADVKRSDNSGMDIHDAVRIQEYVGGAQTQIVDQPHKADSTGTIVNPPVVDNEKFTMQVNQNGYINNENEDATVVRITPTKNITEAKDYTVKVEDKDGNEVASSQYTSTDINAGKITYKPEEKYKDITIDFSGVFNGGVYDGEEEGILTIKLIDEKGKVVGAITVDANLAEPEIAQIITNRIDTDRATMSFKSMGENKDGKMYAEKMYYIVVDEAKTVTDISYDETSKKYMATITGETDKKEAKTANVNNGVLNNEVVATDLKTTQEYKVYYVLENGYGSLSTIDNASIISDTIREAMKQVEITVPDLDKNETEFTWKAVKDEAGNTATEYDITLYKDGEIIDEVLNDNTLTYDAEDKIKENGAGAYHIEVITLGDATNSTKNSAPKASADVTVEALKSVTDVKFEINTENKAMLSWKDSSNKKSNVSKYEVTLYKLVNGKYVEEPAKVSTTGTQTELDITAKMNVNTAYKAEVVAVAKDDQVKIANSTETPIEGFYKVDANVSVAATTENSVTLRLVDAKVDGNSATYKVNVYTVINGNPFETRYTPVAGNPRSVTLTDGKIVIDGLKDNQDYAFKLVATADNGNINGESNYIEGAKTFAVAPRINKLEKVAAEKDAKEGKIYKSGNDLIVNGEDTIDLSTAYYSNKFKAMMDVVDTLQAGDIVTVADEVLTLQLPSVASSQTIDFANTAKDLNIVLETNRHNKIISTTATTGKAKEVTLKNMDKSKFEWAIFDASGLDSEKIVLTDKVRVSGDKEYTVAAGSTVQINGVEVYAQKETVITATGKSLAVEANKESNDLSFTNIIADNVTGTDATITFVGTDDEEAKQLGKITIKTEGGKVTVNQSGVAVNSKLVVDVKNGNVEIADPAFTGSKDITVSNDEGTTTTIKAIAKTEAHDILKDQTITLKTYTLKDDTDELEALLDVTTGASGKEYAATKKALLTDNADATNEEVLDALLSVVNEYVNTYGNIKNSNATVVIEPDGKTVTITTDRDTKLENVNISDIIK